MNEVSLVIYFGNITTFILMLYLTFLNPSLLNNQYWVYILIGLFTAIVFHTGHEAGKSKWFIMSYVLLWLFISFLVGYIFFLFMLIVPFMRLTSCLFCFLLGFFMRILCFFTNILIFVTFYSSILFHFPYHISFFILFLSNITIISLLLILFFIFLSVFTLITRLFVNYN
jgi:hypothetical protein